MTRSRIARAAALAAVLAAAPLPAMAEFLSPDWSSFSISGIEQPDWVAGEREGNYIGMCLTCGETLMFQVQTLPDDGTGGRVKSGETTAETYTEIGKANAERLGSGAAYYGTEDISFASAVGFKTSAMTATGDYASTYQLWDDGQQLIVKAYGKDQKRVEKLAKDAFTAAAPMTFK